MLSLGNNPDSNTKVQINQGIQGKNQSIHKKDCGDYWFK